MPRGLRMLFEAVRDDLGPGGVLTEVLAAQVVAEQGADAGELAMVAGAGEQPVDGVQASDQYGVFVELVVPERPSGTQGVLPRIDR